MRFQKYIVHIIHNIFIKNKETGLIFIEIVQVPIFHFSCPIIHGFWVICDYNDYLVKFFVGVHDDFINDVCWSGRTNVGFWVI